MSDDRFKNKYRIETARAWWHDYNGGAYFVTICTKNRDHYFGEIENGQMMLSVIGEHVSKCIEEIPNHNPYAIISKFTIMPNHLHLIVLISMPYDGRDAPWCVSDDNASVGRDAPWCVSDEITTSGKETHHGASLQRGDDAENVMRTMALQKGKLSVTIGGFKQSITRFANENDIEFAWQTRFHDHIIQEIDEMNRVATYIENNVANWVDDEFYSPKKNNVD